MKVVFSRIYIEKANEGSAIQDRTSLLVWFLSALKWKSFGYETILYTDETTKEKFDELGLSSVYDEIKMINKNDVEEDVFWACSKILSARQFMEEYPNEEFMISDLDFIPLKDPKNFVKSDNDLLSFYHEYVESYCPIEYLELSPDYTLPEYFTGKINPINTCMLYIRQSLLDIFNNYLDIELEFMKLHKTFISGQKSNELMIFIEQQLFTEYLISNNVDITLITSERQTVFNPNGMHTGPYKSIEKAEYWKWIIWWLKEIKGINEEVLNNILSLEMYSDINTIITDGSGSYTNKKGSETSVTNFSWDNLEYPRAFEDVYDEYWINP